MEFQQKGPACHLHTLCRWQAGLELALSFQQARLHPKNTHDELSIATLLTNIELLHTIFGTKEEHLEMLMPCLEVQPCCVFTQAP